MTEQLPFDQGPPDTFADLGDPSLALKYLIAAYGYEAVALELRKQAPTFPAESAPARPSDPETSHLASKREHDVGRFSTNSRQSKLLYVMSTRDCTDQEATTRIVGSTAPPSAFEGCRRRMSDLRAVNYIVDSGVRRKNPGSDDDSIVWTLSDAGREALIRLDDTGWSR